MSVILPLFPHIFKYKNTSKINWIEQNQPRVMKLNQIVKIGSSKILGKNHI